MARRPLPEPEVRRRVCRRRGGTGRRHGCPGCRESLRFPSRSSPGAEFSGTDAGRARSRRRCPAADRRGRRAVPGSAGIGARRFALTKPGPAPVCRSHPHDASTAQRLRRRSTPVASRFGKSEHRDERRFRLESASTASVSAWALPASWKTAARTAPRCRSATVRTASPGLPSRCQRSAVWIAVSDAAGIGTARSRTTIPIPGARAASPQRRRLCGRAAGRRRGRAGPAKIRRGHGGAEQRKRWG